MRRTGGVNPIKFLYVSKLRTALLDTIGVQRTECMQYPVFAGYTKRLITIGHKRKMATLEKRTINKGSFEEMLTDLRKLVHDLYEECL